MSQADSGINLMGDTSSSSPLLSDNPAPAPKPKPVKLRAIGDSRATRKAIDDSVFDTASNLAPVSNKTHTLSLKNVQWMDGDHFSKKERKDGALKGNTLGRRLRGTWELSDNATGNVVDSRDQVIFKLPHLSDDGTFIHNGSDYAIRHQERLNPGIYTRKKDNGEIESHLNILRGGPSHRIEIDPGKGVFKINVGQAHIPLLPLLEHLGASEHEIRDAWGDDLYARNYSASDGSATNRIVEKFLNGKVPDGVPAHEAIRQKFENMEVSPEVNQHTLGHPHARLDKHAYLDTTRKLLAVSKGEKEPDDRDHLAYQTFLGPEDIFKERLAKDRAGVRRQLLFKASMKGHLGSMPSSALQQQIDSALIGSGLGQNLEHINPLEVLDKNTQVTRMGEGGIPSTQSVPDEARSVQPSHFNFIDSVRTPENERAGVDVFLASNTSKGDDGKLYSRFTDHKTGQTVWKSPQDVADQVITFPGAMNMPGKRVPVIKKGKLTYARKNEVNLVLPPMEHTFSPLGNLVPLKSMVKAQRMVMASRMMTQALPLENAESPHVQSGISGTNGTKSYEEHYGKHAGAINAEQGGKVIDVSPEHMTVRYDDGKTDKVELHNNTPYNRKTFIHQTPLIQPGERFSAGQPIAKSNFTDKNGAAALGINMRVAYLPWKGQNFEDASIISESTAQRLRSQHAYQHELEVTDRTRTGRNNYISLFPSRFDKKTLENIDEHGRIKPGTKVKYGDPLILGAEERAVAQNKVHKKGQPAFNDMSVTWDHHDPGEVTDVVDGKNGPVVVVKSTRAMQVADKLSGRFGDKGVVSAIIPDHQMPHDVNGKPYELLLNPLGVVSRTNPAQWVEAKLGQIAEKTGKPFKVEDFDEKVPDRIKWVKQLMQQHGIQDQEDVYDPVRGTKIPGVFTGNRFMMKLSHMSEDKGQARGGGAYTAFDEPAKGGASGSKRISGLDLSALLSHGATSVIRDAGAVRGQRNDDWWLQFMQGNTPRDPKIPMVYHKFLNDLKASGINVVKDGSQLHMMALTNKDVDQLAGDRNVEHGETVKFHDGLDPIQGGLFDKKLTGGHHSSRWSAVKLHEAFPSPVMEEPIRRVLGLTQKKFESVIAGKEPINSGGESGPAAIGKALSNIDLDKEIAVARNKIKFGTKGDRDKAVRNLGYLKSAKRLEMHPRDWMLNRVPVLPTQFRPINTLGNKNIPLVSDPNYLYKELIEANKNLSDMHGKVGDDVGEERLAVYNAFKGVTGLGEPITQANKDKQVKGILRSVLGSSPKFNTVQRRLLSSTVDNVGRAVISPDPDLDMDEAAIPEHHAFDAYGRFIARRLKRTGMPLHQALQEIKNRTPLARNMLVQEMEHRPVIVNRAPVLHKFGILALRPKLTKNSSMQLSPLIYKGLGGDNDGDQMQYHVPASEDARIEALERMLPSRNLISPADFKTPMYAPTQEYTGGIWQATTKKSKRKHTFRNLTDAKAAWRRGDIGIGDLVDLIDKKQSHG